MAIRVEQLHSRSDRDRFIKFPWKVYKGDRNWVPPLLLERHHFLDPQKNPFFEHSNIGLFLAFDPAGHEAGRIAAIVNHNHVSTHNENAGFFGLFESMDNPDVARALFETAAGFLRSRGMEIMRGPENMSVNDDLGLLIKGFDSPPSFMMPYNPPYYEKLVESFGFCKAMDLYAYDGVHNGVIPDRLQRAVEVARKRNPFSLRTIDMRRFESEVKLVRQVYNQAWERNWGAVAMTGKEFDYLAKDLKSVIDPGLCLIAEVEGKPAGFSLALPDYNQVLIRLDGRLFPFGLFKFLYLKRKINRARILTMGVLEQYRRMGIDMAFIHETYRQSIAKGIDGGEMSWILETNAPMNNALTRLGYNLYKTYRLYDYRL